ncbi:hypothetical protein [Lutibaculum baratangense]|uniref:Uncharacterized protein n=1 Tax=Lutibaculum baratangense AMV1 TaxID=631454 RepID=V4TA44_9HYPH|nr:hypothetical protein [Lutibaculum baratangense]ESR23358.1 hypothetical protein N177_3426 [Lutibaculum baratangense AMV1]
MTSHAYTVGQNVRLAGSTLHQGLDGVYKILALLPEERGDWQYRVESMSRPQQRVVTESQITHADSSPALASGG